MKKIMMILMILALVGCAQQAVVEPEPVEVSEPEVVEVSEPEVQETITVTPQPIAEKKETAPAPSTAQDPILLKQGTFQKVTHRTSGLVKIYKQPDGKQLLTMTGFDTTPGPGLTVILHKGIPANGHVAGRLVSASGNYPYDLPANLDVSPFTHAAIYNAKYDVVYGEAELR